MLDVVDRSFDIKRAFLLTTPLRETLTVGATIPLSEAFASGKTLNETPVQVCEIGGTALVIQTLQLLMHPIAEANWHGQAIAISFCAICNSSVALATRLNETVYHFVQGGLYNGMMLLRDRETGSYWDHITGECVYGVKEGTQLQRLATLLQMTAKQALAAYPDAMIVVSDLSMEQEIAARQQNSARMAAAPDLSRVASTIGAEDARLPRLEMGLGIWTPIMSTTATASTYYPMSRLHALDNAVFDRLAGRQLLIYVDPESDTPAALFTDATAAFWKGNELHLNNGYRLREGVLYAANGQRHWAQRPAQLFQRWYGFALTFPDCAIFAG